MGSVVLRCINRGISMRRDVSIELLRCCMMLLIVLHHCCLFGVHKHPAVGGLSASTLFAVDVFVLISGWYGVRFSEKKVLKLLEQGVFAVLFVGLIAGLTGAGWDFRFSLGWFGNAYLALLCVSPIINAGIDSLRQGGGASQGLVRVCGHHVCVLDSLRVECERLVRPFV